MHHKMTAMKVYNEMHFRADDGSWVTIFDWSHGSWLQFVDPWPSYIIFRITFLADRTDCCAYGTVLCLSACLSSVMYVLWVNKKTVLRSKQEMAYGESIDHVTDDVTWPWKIKMFGPISSTTAAEYRLGCSGTHAKCLLVGRKVTLPTTWYWAVNMLTAEYLENDWRYTLGSKGQPIRNGIWRIEWSRDRRIDDALSLS